MAIFSAYVAAAARAVRGGRASDGRRRRTVTPLGPRVRGRRTAWFRAAGDLARHDDGQHRGHRRGGHPGEGPPLAPPPARPLGPQRRRLPRRPGPPSAPRRRAVRRRLGSGRSRSKTTDRPVNRPPGGTPPGFARRRGRRPRTRRRRERVQILPPRTRGARGATGVAVRPGHPGCGPSEGRGDARAQRPPAAAGSGARGSRPRACRALGPPPAGGRAPPGAGAGAPAAAGLALFEVAAGARRPDGGYRRPPPGPPPPPGPRGRRRRPPSGPGAAPRERGRRARAGLGGRGPWLLARGGRRPGVRRALPACGCGVPLGTPRVLSRPSRLPPGPPSLSASSSRKAPATSSGYSIIATCPACGSVSSREPRKVDARPARHTVRDQLVHAPVHEQRRREHPLRLSPQRVLPAEGVRVDEPARGTGQRVPEVRQGRAAVRIPRPPPQVLRGHPARVPVAQRQSTSRVRRSGVHPLVSRPNSPVTPGTASSAVGTAVRWGAAPGARARPGSACGPGPAAARRPG